MTECYIQLEWYCTSNLHDVHKTKDRAFAKIKYLEHTVGFAGFEVYKDMYYEKRWRCIFWHGGRGHSIGTSYDTKNEAQEIAEKHINKIFQDLLTPNREDND